MTTASITDEPAKQCAGARSIAWHVSLAGLVASDLRAKATWYYDRSDWKAIGKVLLTDGTAAMILYRLMQWSRRWRLGPL
jgi:hypothetical protein